MAETAATTQEVVEAVRRATLIRDGKWWYPASKADVTEEVARGRGAPAYDPADGLRRSSFLRKYVSLGSLDGILDELVEKGEVFALPGTHEIFRHRHAVYSKATYYLCPEAYELAVMARSDKWRNMADGQADRYAFDRFAEEHPELYHKYRAEWNEKNREPNWREM